MDWLTGINWNEILNYGLKIIGIAAGTVITTYASILFTKLKTKLYESRIVSYVKEAVKAAEQLYPNQGKKMGKEKLTYVTEQVLNKFPKLTDNEYLRSIIEGAVFSVSEEIKLIQAEKTNVTSLKIS